MLQENLELAYRFTNGSNRRDLDSFLALCDAEVEYSPTSWNWKEAL